MADYLIVPTEMHHLPHVAEHMREADREEIRAAGRPDPLDALTLSYQASERCYTVFIEGAPAIVFGIVPHSLLDRGGVVWLLATDAFTRLKKDRRTMLDMHYQLAELIKGYRRVENFVHDKNAVSKKWLAWLGFEIHEPQPHGPYGEPFCHFEMRVH